MKKHITQPIDTLRGAFISVLKIKRNDAVDDWIQVKLSEIKSIEADERYSNIEGSSIKTYKDSSYYCFMSPDELLRIINLFIFKPDEYFESYGM